MRLLSTTDNTAGAVYGNTSFNDASLTIEGTDVDIMPASYATNGTDKDGITAEIVDVGTGKAEDYEGLDVKDKIVLAGVD